MVREYEGLRVEVKVRALRPTPYKWEIYEGDRPRCIKQSAGSFRSERAAREAGNVALMDLLKSRSNAKRS